MPALTIETRESLQFEQGLEGVCAYLSEMNEEIVIAIDEFQQIRNYPEKNVEALLRSNFQHLSNVTFIFSGSHKHLMLSIFSERNSPFYQSTQIMNLGYIDRQKYKQFIIDKFEANKREIATEVVNDGLDWCMGHTYYVQYFFNRLYGNTQGKIGLEEARLNKEMILEENSSIYDNYRKLLSKAQFALLKAMAKEVYVKQITSFDFISKYQISSASTVRQAFLVLMNHNLVLDEVDGHRLADVFFMQWLAK